MKVAEITELRSEPGSLLEQDEPDDLRHELIGVLGRHISGSLEARGITEKAIQEDFDAHRRPSPAP